MLHPSSGTGCQTSFIKQKTLLLFSRSWNHIYFKLCDPLIPFPSSAPPCLPTPSPFSIFFVKHKEHVVFMHRVRLHSTKGHWHWKLTSHWIPHSPRRLCPFSNVYVCFHFSCVWRVRLVTRTVHCVTACDRRCWCRSNVSLYLHSWYYSWATGRLSLCKVHLCLQCWYSSWVTGIHCHSQRQLALNSSINRCTSHSCAQRFSTVSPHNTDWEKG